MAQLETAEFFPPLGQIGGPAQPWPLAAGVDPLDLGAHRSKDLLLMAEPIDPSVVRTLGPFGPLGTDPWPEGGEWGWTGDRLGLHVAATTGRSSANDDIPPATYVPGKLQPFNFGARLFDGVDPAARSRPAQGVIGLTDPDDGLCGLLHYIWDSAPLTLRRGERDTPFSTWQIVGRFRSAGLLYDLDQKQILLRDLGWQLSGPLHAEYYGGTGGLDGDASLKGTFKPWALGYCFNVEPVLIGASAQVFQWSLTSSAALIDIRHGGVSLAFHADFPTYGALAAATTIPSGCYGTCLASSLVRPNVTLQYGIRVDVQGDNETAYGHTAPMTRATIARRIATTRGSKLDDDAEIDATAFNRVEARHSAPVGWFFGTAISKADALDRIMAGILGWWRVRPDGRLAIGYVDAPTRGSGLAIEYRAEGMGLPRMVAWAPPRAGTYMSWRTNYGPQARSALAPSVDETSASIYGQGARYVTALSPAVVSLYPTAPYVTIGELGFWQETDAIVEAARQQNILQVERRRWQVDFDIDPFADLLGSTITITGANVLGLGPARPLLAVGIDTPGTETTTFDLWG